MTLKALGLIQMLIRLGLPYPLAKNPTLDYSMDYMQT